MKCAICNKEMERGEGFLDQCLMTYVPTVTWQCAECDYKVWEKSTAPWKCYDIEGITPRGE